MSTTDIVVDILTKVAPPVVSGVGGALTAAWRFTTGIVVRVKKLEDAQKRLTATFEILGQSYKDLEKSIEDLRNQKQLQRLTDKVTKNERRISELDEDIARIDKTIMDFVKEQNDQWQNMNRQLGRLEGILQGRESIHD